MRYVKFFLVNPYTGEEKDDYAEFEDDIWKDEIEDFFVDLCYEFGNEAKYEIGLSPDQEEKYYDDIWDRSSWCFITEYEYEEK